MSSMNQPVNIQRFVLLCCFKRNYKVCMWYVRTRQWYGLYTEDFKMKRYRKFLFQVVRERLALGRFAGAG